MIKQAHNNDKLSCKCGLAQWSPGWYVMCFYRALWASDSLFSTDDCSTFPIREVNWLLIISVLISLWRIVHSNPTHRNEMPHIMYLRTFVREVQPHVVALSVVFGLINHADRRRSQ